MKISNYQVQQLYLIAIASLVYSADMGLACSDRQKIVDEILDQQSKIIVELENEKPSGAALTELVREMGKWMDKIGWPCQDNMAPEDEELYAEGVEITNRPEVRAIMAEGE